jgi:hypothetical protein
VKLAAVAAAKALGPEQDFSQDMSHHLCRVCITPHTLFSFLSSAVQGSALAVHITTKEWSHSFVPPKEYEEEAIQAVQSVPAPVAVFGGGVAAVGQQEDVAGDAQDDNDDHIITYSQPLTQLQVYRVYCWVVQDRGVENTPRMICMTQ